MPGYRGHIVGGCVAYAFFVLVVSSLAVVPMRIGVWLVCTLAGALFPDVDVKSRGQNGFYMLIFVCLLYCIIVSQWHLASLIGFFSLLPMLVPHRGLFHRLWFITILSGGATVLITTYTTISLVNAGMCALFFNVGALSHLWLDGGVRYLFRW